jgi:hypothetical protein
VSGDEGWKESRGYKERGQERLKVLIVRERRIRKEEPERMKIQNLQKGEVSVIARSLLFRLI